MWQFLTDVIGTTVAGFGDRFAAIGPKLLAMVVILVAGMVAAVGVRLFLRFVLPRLGFDSFARQLGISVLLQKGGVTAPPSSVAAALAAWGVLSVFVVLAIGALNLPFATDLLTRAVTYLPQLLIALALVLLGALVAGFLRRSVLIAAVNAGLPQARLLAGGVQLALMTLFVAMALEHVGVGRQILLTSFAILFGGVVLSLALAFGLAGRDLAREFLEGLVHPRHEERGDTLHHV